MKTKELIEKLQQFDGEMEVCLFDWRKNIHYDEDDGSSEGILSSFDIIKMDLSGHKERTAVDSESWIAIAFNNNDYNDDGLPAFAISEEEKIRDDAHWSAIWWAVTEAYSFDEQMAEELIRNSGITHEKCIEMLEQIEYNKEGLQPLVELIF